MIYATLAFVFVAVAALFSRGLIIAFQATTVDVEIPVSMDTSIKFAAQLDSSSKSPLKQPLIEETMNGNTALSGSSSDPPPMEIDEVYDWSPRPYEPTPRPPVEHIVMGWNVTGDPQWLINFAIVAFPKCGTSTLMHYFAKNPEIQIPKDERCELGANQHVPLMRDLYTDYAAGDYVRGIKCPSNLENDLSKKNLQRYFPKTDMLIGIRHPIKWFESFYNHRIQNDHNMRNITDLIGGCGKKSYGVCTNRASFHTSLSHLGKTALTKTEQELFPAYSKRWYGKKMNLSNRVFFYEVEQLNDKNASRAQVFRKDLQRFLYLRKPLPPMVWFKPGRKNVDYEYQKRVDENKIDICDDQFAKLREVLLGHAVNVSKWVRRHFLSSDTVHVSSRDHFESILENWKHDPCHDGGSYKTVAANMTCTRYGCFLIKGHQNATPAAPSSTLRV
jgi:hypothetical protein